VNSQANGDDWQDDTPLGSVAATCSFEIAELLVKLGADPSLPGWMGNSAMDQAKERTDPEGRAVYNLLLKGIRSKTHKH
jgi:ankyrin repeat protein